MRIVRCPTGRRNSGGDGWRGRDEAGVSMLDAVLASAVVLMILVPMVSVMSSSAGVVASSGHRLTAQGIASGWIQQELATASSSGTGPGTVCTAGTYANAGWTDVSCPGAPSVSWPSTPTTTETVDAVTYDITVVGGWCALSTATWTWGDGASSAVSSTGQPTVATPYTFFLAVSVTSVQDDLMSGGVGRSLVRSPVPSQATWTMPSTAITTADPYQCPAALT